MRVLLRDRAVRCPARVAEAVIRRRAVRAGGLLQELEVPDGADVVETVLLAQRDPSGVVAAVLEPLQPVEQEILCLTTADVTDDPAHLDSSRLPPQDVRRVVCAPRLQFSRMTLGPKRQSPADSPLPCVGGR